MTDLGSLKAKLDIHLQEEILQVVQLRGVWLTIVVVVVFFWGGGDVSFVFWCVGVVFVCCCCFLVGEGFSACFVVLSFQWPVGQSLICIVYKVHIG